MNVNLTADLQESYQQQHAKIMYHVSNIIERVCTRPFSVLLYVTKLVFLFFSVPMLMYIFKSDLFAKDRKPVHIVGKKVLTYGTFVKMKDVLINLGELDFPEYPDDIQSCTVKMDSLGPITANKKEVDLNWLSTQMPEVRRGGYYAPKNCKARHKVAIIVPFRARKRNLGIFLRHMHPFLKKQQIEYRIFVIEQFGTGKFNKGALYNIGFLESQRYGPFDCYVFHEVDLLPLDERILYTCPKRPTHMATSVESIGYLLPSSKRFGGVTSLTPLHFEAVNGYSNEYWGWGAEDDMFMRLLTRRFHVVRYNRTIARYATLPHETSAINYVRYAISRSQKPKDRFWHEGLRTIKYRFLGRYPKKLFLLLLVDVSPLE